MVQRKIGAAIVLFVGWVIARIITPSVRMVFSKTKFDRMLVHFVTSLVYMGLIVIAVIAALSAMGGDVSSFGEVIRAAVCVLGFALQGSLGNFAAGVMLMIFRPFKEGDLVEPAGSWGRWKRLGSSPRSSTPSRTKKPSCRTPKSRATTSSTTAPTARSAWTGPLGLATRTMWIRPC